MSKRKLTLEDLDERLSALEQKRSAVTRAENEVLLRARQLATLETMGWYIKTAGGKEERVILGHGDIEPTREFLRKALLHAAHELVATETFCAQKA